MKRLNQNLGGVENGQSDDMIVTQTNNDPFISDVGIICGLRQIKIYIKGVSVRGIIKMSFFYKIRLGHLTFLNLIRERMDGLSGRVLARGGGQCKVRQAQKALLRGYRLMLQSFLFSFLGLYKKCDYKKYKPQYRQCDSQPKGKFNKKFACQSYGKYSFRDISKVTRRKFHTVFINDYHQFNFNIQRELCQGVFGQLLTDCAGGVSRLRQGSWARVNKPASLP